MNWHLGGCLKKSALLPATEVAASGAKSACVHLAVDSILAKRRVWKPALRHVHLGGYPKRSAPLLSLGDCEIGLRAHALTS